MKITFYSSKKYDTDSFKKHNLENYELEFLESSLTQESAALSKWSDAVCVFVNDRVDAKIIDILKKNWVKLILLRCAGFDKVDHQYAATQWIKVMRVPMYSPHAVAQHALWLLLCANRNIHTANNRVKKNNFTLDWLIWSDIQDKTIGIIGTWLIWAIFAKMMHWWFGCNILAYDIVQSEELISLWVKYTDLEDLFTQSDIISLHCPLFPSTKNMINKQSIEQMKSWVMIINTSRWELVETHDILDGLDQGKIWYFATDVYENEQNIFFTDHEDKDLKDPVLKKLQEHPKVLLTPHQAFLTHEALDQIAKTTFVNIKDFIKGNESHNYVL